MVNLAKEVQEAMWGDAALLKTLETHEQQFKAGNKSVVLDAIDFCGHNQLVMPDWLRDAWSGAMDGLRSGKIRSADEAFGIKLENPLKRQRNYALEKMRFLIHTALFKHRLKKKYNGFNTDDLDGIAEDVGVPRDYVKEVLKRHPSLKSLRRNPGNIIHAIAHTTSSMPKRYGRPIVRDSSE